MEILFWSVQVITSSGFCDAHSSTFWLEMHTAMLTSLLCDHIPDDDVVIFTAEDPVHARRLDAFVEVEFFS